MMWVWIGVAIEVMALASVLGVRLTGRALAGFVIGFDTMAVVTGIYVATAVPGPRTILVAIFVVFYLIRMNWVMIGWRKQTALGKIETKIAAAERSFLMVVLTNTVGWAYCLPLYFATRRAGPLGPSDLFAVVVYVAGTVFHFGGDYQKRRFKTARGGDGGLLDSGFWSLCRHPNYFGDFLIYVSFAIVGGVVWGWIAPLVNLLQYAFDAIPKNEKWAAERYGPAWQAYKKKTKAFVPFVV